MTRRGQAGFTLIEMTVAFVILSLSLSALYQSFAASLARTGHDRRLEEAILVADSLLSRAGTEWPLAQGEHSGQESGYEYELSEEPFPVPDLRAHGNEPPYTLAMMKVTASVSWRDESGARSHTVSTLKWRAPPP